MFIVRDIGQSKKFLSVVEQPTPSALQPCHSSQDLGQNDKERRQPFHGSILSLISGTTKPLIYQGRNFVSKILNCAGRPEPGASGGVITIPTFPTSHPPAVSPPGSSPVVGPIPA